LNAPTSASPKTLSHIIKEEVMNKWEEITQDLYSKISPTGGKLCSKISNGYKTRNWIDNIWVEIYMNEFAYNDPFYGEIQSKSNFTTFFNLSDLVTELKFESILDIQNLEFDGEGDYLNGGFSNSLNLLVTKLKFGEIKDWKINMKINYSLANSESYGYMTGTVKDHLTKSGKIETKLDVRELELVCLNEKDPYEDAKYLNWRIYNPEKLRLAPDLNWSSDHSKGFYIPYRDINQRNKIENEYPFQFSHENTTKKPD